MRLEMAIRQGDRVGDQMDGDVLTRRVRHIELDKGRACLQWADDQTGGGEPVAHV
jgi:hypothetical protein